MNRIYVNSNSILKKQKNFWNSFLFHPTDGVEDDWGYKILKQISEDKASNMVRIYSMFEDIVSIDKNGNLCYDFTLNDIRIDRLLECGFIPLIAYCGIPACIAEDPEMNNTNSHGWLRYKDKKFITSMPKDTALWEEICYEYTKHIVEKYGMEEVSRWYFTCLNEPDSPGYFLPYEKDEVKRASYNKMYDAFARGVDRVSSELRIGGPTVSGEEDIELLDSFLKHIMETNTRLNFVSVHAYGTTPWHIRDGSRPFTIQNHFDRIHVYRDIINKYYPDGIEFVVDEWGACTNGYSQKSEYPELNFRETPQFAAYFANMIAQYIYKESLIPSILMICLSGQHTMKAEFEGFRNFFSLNFIRKPIYNGYILMNKIHENILESQTDIENLTLIPTKSEDDSLAIILSHAAEDFRENLPTINDSLVIDGVNGEKKITVWTIDNNNTFPYGEMLKKGYCEPLTKEQIEYLKDVSMLKPKTYTAEASGKLTVEIELAGNGIILVEVTNP